MNRDIVFDSTCDSLSPSARDFAREFGERVYWLLDVAVYSLPALVWRIDLALSTDSKCVNLNDRKQLREELVLIGNEFEALPHHTDELFIELTGFVRATLGDLNCLTHDSEVGRHFSRLVNAVEGTRPVETVDVESVFTDTRLHNPFYFLCTTVSANKDAIWHVLTAFSWVLRCHYVLEPLLGIGRESCAFFRDEQYRSDVETLARDLANRRNNMPFKSSEVANVAPDPVPKLTSKGEAADELVTYADLKDMFGVSASTPRLWKSLGIISPVDEKGPRKCLLFNKSTEVPKIIKATKNQPVGTQ